MSSNTVAGNCMLDGTCGVAGYLCVSDYDCNNEATNGYFKCVSGKCASYTVPATGYCERSEYCTVGNKLGKICALSSHNVGTCGAGNKYLDDIELKGLKCGIYDGVYGDDYTVACSECAASQCEGCISTHGLVPPPGGQKTNRCIRSCADGINKIECKCAPTGNAKDSIVDGDYAICKVNQQCTRSTKTCATIGGCTTIPNCDFCDDKVCLTCKTGFYCNDLESCTQCVPKCTALQNCEYCPTETSCSRCDNGFVANSAGQCIEQCRPNSANFDNCTCLKREDCSESTYCSDGKCIECSKNCTTCTEAGLCSKCSTGNGCVDQGKLSSTNCQTCTRICTEEIISGCVCQSTDKSAASQCGDESTCQATSGTCSVVPECTADSAEICMCNNEQCRADEGYKCLNNTCLKDCSAAENTEKCFCDGKSCGDGENAFMCTAAKECLITCADRIGSEMCYCSEGQKCTAQQLCAAGKCATQCQINTDLTGQSCACGNGSCAEGERCQYVVIEGLATTQTKCMPVTYQSCDYDYDCDGIAKNAKYYCKCSSEATDPAKCLKETNKFCAKYEIQSGSSICYRSSDCPQDTTGGNVSGSYCLTPGTESCTTCKTNTNNELSYKKCNCGTPMMTSCMECSYKSNDQKCYKCIDTDIRPENSICTVPCEVGVATKEDCTCQSNVCFNKQICSAAGTCSYSCTIANCDVCDIYGTCTKCKETYQCNDENNCTSCIGGVKCIENCSKCTNTTTCDTCNPTYGCAASITGGACNACTLSCNEEADPAKQQFCGSTQTCLSKKCYDPCTEQSTKDCVSNGVVCLIESTQYFSGGKCLDKCGTQICTAQQSCIAEKCQSLCTTQLTKDCVCGGALCAAPKICQAGSCVVPCTVGNCSECDANGVCVKCNSKYELKENKCQKKEKNANMVGIICGVVVAVVVIIIAIVIAVVCVKKNKKAAAKANSRKNVQEEEEETYGQQPQANVAAGQELI